MRRDAKELIYSLCGQRQLRAMISLYKTETQKLGKGHWLIDFAGTTIVPKVQLTMSQNLGVMPR